MPGTLHVVATPLGNLGDITRRAHEVLAAADLVAAEDTRRTGLLLAHLGLSKPQLACHKFGEKKVLDALLGALAEGKSIALVTDGGTPAISDPGYRLVAAARDAGHAVVPVPGPSAVVAALSVAGLPADRFHFAGFLPATAAQRRRDLARIASLPETLVVFEAPHRALEFLDDAAEILGDRAAVLCRELTKLHEETRRGTLRSLRADLAGRTQIRGEIVFVVAGAAGPPTASTLPADPALAAAWRAALAGEDGDERRAFRRLAREMDLPRAEIRRRLQTSGLVT